METRELDRYKRLLLAKLDELSARKNRAETLVPGAGGWHGHGGKRRQEERGRL